MDEFDVEGWKCIGAVVKLSAERARHIAKTESMPVKRYGRGRVVARRSDLAAWASSRLA